MWLLERMDQLYSNIAANAAGFNVMTVAMLGSRLAHKKKDYFAEHHRATKLEEVADDLEELAEQLYGKVP